jgi:hypothetical protein
MLGQNPFIGFLVTNTQQAHGNVDLHRLLYRFLESLILRKKLRDEFVEPLHGVVVYRSQYLCDIEWPHDSGQSISRKYQVP